MKRKLSLFLAAILMAAAFSACGSSANAPAADAPLSIVASIFPEYDWVKNILGENPAGAELTLLLDSGVDLHSYQPTAADILLISDCDLFIYVGGENDEWVEDVLAGGGKEDRITINLLDSLGSMVKEEELVPGMEEEDEEEGEEDEIEYDEHVWLSLRNASVLCEEIEKAIAALDPAHEDVYRQNLGAYREKLSALDAEYTSAVSSSALDTLLFGDRFPFRYLTDDYDLNYYAAFAGCSAEAEASFETVLFLAQKLDELKLHSIMTIEGSNGSIAETIVDNTETKDQEIRTLNSMQSVTAADVAAGADYLQIMKDNLSVIKEALR